MCVTVQLETMKTKKTIGIRCDSRHAVFDVCVKKKNPMWAGLSGDRDVKNLFAGFGAPDGFVCWCLSSQPRQGAHIS